VIAAKMAPAILRSDWQHEKEDTLSGKEWDVEENGWEKDSVVYIYDMLDLEDAMEHGNGREEVSSQPPVVTSSGRVVRMGQLCQ
jgi:hypothetical protein